MPDFLREADIGGEQENGHLGLGLTHFPGDFAAVHSGHGVVEDDGFDGLGGEEFQAGVAVGGGEDLVAGTFEQDLADPQANDFVVHA